MEDPAAGTTSPESGADTLFKRLQALGLQTDEDKIDTTRAVQDSVSSINEPSTANGEKPPSRPLFSSMREALKSSGQVKEEPGGYVIKRRSISINKTSNSSQQQQRSAESTLRPKNRQAKQRSTNKGSGDVRIPVNPEDEADAAGYTVIRRRSSCDESSSASAAAFQSARRNPRVSTPARNGNKKQQRPRRGSMSALQQSSSVLGSMAPPSSSVPPGFQPRATSRVLRPPPGLTSAASGWVVKAAAPAENANKIAEPPVEALWPEMKATTKTDSGWSTSESLQAQAWPAVSSAASAGCLEDQNQKEEVDDDDLLARLGVTL